MWQIPSDFSGAGALLPGTDVPGNIGPLDWSPNGDVLLWGSPEGLHAYRVKAGAGDGADSAPLLFHLGHFLGHKGVDHTPVIRSISDPAFKLCGCVPVIALARKNETADPWIHLFHHADVFPCLLCVAGRFLLSLVADLPCFY